VSVLACGSQATRILPGPARDNARHEPNGLPLSDRCPTHQRSPKPAVGWENSRGPREGAPAPCLSRVALACGEARYRVAKSLDLVPNSEMHHRAQSAGAGQERRGAVAIQHNSRRVEFAFGPALHCRALREKRPATD
jgi:hypothetical protein